MGSLSVTLGCDPEIFVSPKGKKNIVTAHGLIPGNKYDPHNILDGLGMVQVDGCALEFGIKAAANQTEWYSRIKATMNEMAMMLPNHQFRIQPTAEFAKDYWEKDVPDMAKQLGCEPDWNAWTGDVNPPPNTIEFPTLRSAGGHIHIGWTKGKDPLEKNHLEDCRLVVKQMDYYLGIYSLLYDPDTKRRSLYGKAGAFRPKPYGVEYRSLSNMWLSADPLIDWVYWSARQAVLDLAAGKSAEKMYGEAAKEIIDSNILDWVSSQPVNVGTNSQYKWVVNGAYKRVEGLRGPQWSEPRAIR